ncbi:NAD-dependent epimerase/dehydratase family protein [Rhodothermus profundi]|uniref:UDP-glucose 4-epimerase n=1 Tax=Rhodothermus profundi TaxID=633813 RepID=A0A1M6XJE5_9BACT|nr:SDR family NAD(P)-dependent oxidoreductase [Rhodothermus profundi]SHL06033.1 UDP-glucose 4-epimerase [Rhodothermus profundi]
MTTQRVFVTGGAGFIGRWVVAQCLKQGYQVVVYDNLQAGSVDHLLEFADRIDFYEADILDAATLQAVMEETQPVIVFHLAALHFIPYCNAHPQETLRVNVEGTYNVLNAAARAGVRTAIVASSGAIYPSVEGLIPETLPPAPVDIYGLSKLLTEQVAEQFARTTDMACVAARLFNTYGPFETNPHLIPHIVASLQQGPVVELGNIHTKRDYIYVEDVARLLVALGERVTEGYEIVNVGTGQEYSAEEIVETLSELMGQKITIRIDPDRVRAVDKLHQRADTTRLQQLTGMLPEITLREGLARLLQHEGLPVRTQ